MDTTGINPPKGEYLEYFPSVLPPVDIHLNPIKKLELEIEALRKRNSELENTLAQIKENYDLALEIIKLATK